MQVIELHGNFIFSTKKISVQELFLTDFKDIFSQLFGNIRKIPQKTGDSLVESRYNDCRAVIIPAPVRVEQSETKYLGEPCASPRRDTVASEKSIMEKEQEDA